jgi:MFS family permease
MPERAYPHGGLAVLLLGVGTAWNAGNVGPVTSELSAAFDVSLTTVGLLSGTLLFGSMLAGIGLAPRLAERFGVVELMRAGCLLCALGNVLFALSPGLAGLAGGRVLAGIGLGFAGVLGPVFGRATGGVSRVGVFGAAFQLGIAGGLGVGSLLADGGAGWRVGFWVSALIAISALPLLSRLRAPLRGDDGLRPAPLARRARRPGRAADAAWHRGTDLGGAAGRRRAGGRTRRGRDAGDRRGGGARGPAQPGPGGPVPERRRGGRRALGERALSRRGGSAGRSCIESRRRAARRRSLDHRCLSTTYL